MKLNKTWVIAASLTAMVAANGLALAASQPQPVAAQDKKVVVVNKGEFKNHGRFAFKGESSQLPAFLKLDAATLKSELNAGKTLAAIAGERGITRQQLKDFMVAQMTERLKVAVSAGKLTGVQAEKMQAAMEKRVDAIIDGQGGKFVHKHHGFGHFADSGLLSLLNIDKDTLTAEMKAGKTLAAIAGERGVSRQQLKDFMLARMTERLEQAAGDGKITDAQAEKMKAAVEQRVDAIIDASGPARIHPGARNS